VVDTSEKNHKDFSGETFNTLLFTVHDLRSIGASKACGVFSGLDKVESFGIILSYTFGGKIYEKKT